MTTETETETMTEDPPSTDGIGELLKAVRAGEYIVGDDEARFLVDAYYTAQDHRKRADNQVRSMAAEPAQLLAWLSNENARIEGDMRRVLNAYSARDPLGAWARTQKGVGPIITAGLLAHIRFELPVKGVDGKPLTNGDGNPVMERVQTPSRIWSFAGYNPEMVWGKGKKRPFNAGLKALCWNLGECFVKVHKQPDAFWGHLYAMRKAHEEERNESGALAAQAAKALESKRFTNKEVIAVYQSGKLTKGHIHARAKRWAVKMFLVYWHRVGYVVRFGELPPQPYVIAILGHGGLFEPPGVEEYIEQFLK